MNYPKIPKELRWFIPRTFSLLRKSSIGLNNTWEFPSSPSLIASAYVEVDKPSCAAAAYIVRREYPFLTMKAICAKVLIIVHVFSKLITKSA